MITYEAGNLLFAYIIYPTTRSDFDGHPFAQRKDGCELILRHVDVSLCVSFYPRAYAYRIGYERVVATGARDPSQTHVMPRPTNSQEATARHMSAVDDERISSSRFAMASM